MKTKFSPFADIERPEIPPNSAISCNNGNSPDSEIVENLNHGLVGRIIRRGANHLICVTEDEMMFKSWIKDVSEAVVNATNISGVPASQRLVGTDAHRKYTETLVPGSPWGKQFINKYRKK